jgi:uncharacterized coiled-coil DUF342 family protein
LKCKVDELNQVNAKLSEEVENLRVDVSEKDEEINCLKEKLTNLESKLSDSKKIMDELKCQNSELSEKLSSKPDEKPEEKSEEKPDEPSQEATE